MMQVRASGGIDRRVQEKTVQQRDRPEQNENMHREVGLDEGTFTATPHAFDPPVAPDGNQNQELALVRITSGCSSPDGDRSGEPQVLMSSEPQPQHLCYINQRREYPPSSVQYHPPPPMAHGGHHSDLVAKHNTPVVTSQRVYPQPSSQDRHTHNDGSAPKDVGTEWKSRKRTARVGCSTNRLRS